MALKAARASGATLVSTVYDWGTDYYFKHGAMVPANAIETLREHDAILLGAVGHPKVPDNVTLNGLLLPIRRRFDQFANVRPAVLYRGVSSPLKGMNAGDIDMVVVRENTEGEYAQIGGFVHETHPQEVAIQTSVFTRHGVERIIRYAFELATKRKKKNLVTSITKSNAQGFSMVLWDRVFQSVAAEFPGIKTESLLVDAAAMNFVRRPQPSTWWWLRILFGDILSDISAIVSGSIGLAASANIDPDAAFPVDVRAGAWIGAGYCGKGNCQSAGGDGVGGDDAGSSRSDRGGAEDGCGDCRRACGGKGADARFRRNEFHQ